MNAQVPLDPVELLAAALAIPSVSGSEERLARFLVEQLTPFATDARVDPVGNAVVRFGHGPVRVVFLGHIDTVPGEVPVRRADGRLYGRGAVDAKGPYCAALVAATALPTQVLERLTLVLVGAVEEEAPSSKGAHHIAATEPAPDYLLIGEPSGWQGITFGYKGRLVLHGRVVKANHHSAGGDSSAAEDAVELWLAARSWADAFNAGRERLFEQVQLTLERIDSASDGMEQRCELTIGLRLPADLPPAAAQAELSNLLADARLRFEGGVPAYRAERDNRLARAFRTAIRQQGGVPRVKVKTGTSDMNIVGPLWDVPTVAYGPGDSSLDHTPDEHVEVDELRRSVEVLASVFSSLAAE